MELDQILQLETVFSDLLSNCGENEYVYLNQIRCDLAAYAEDIKTNGPGKRRQGYQEKELKP